MDHDFDATLHSVLPDLATPTRRDRIDSAVDTPPERSTPASAAPPRNPCSDPRESEHPKEPILPVIVRTPPEGRTLVNTTHDRRLRTSLAPKHSRPKARDPKQGEQESEEACPEERHPRTVGTRSATALTATERLFNPETGKPASCSPILSAEALSAEEHSQPK